VLILQCKPIVSYFTKCAIHIVFMISTLCVGDGGAMYIANSVMLNLSQFRNNSCKSNGGAVYSDYGTTAILNNCTLVHNSAGQSGTIYTHLLSIIAFA
jgi:predicted outer membrane repeat protein